MNEHVWFWYFLLGIIYIAILFMLVKPGSNAGGAVVGVSKGLAELVTTAVGGTPANVSPIPIPTGGLLT